PGSRSSSATTVSLSTHRTPRSGRNGSRRLCGSGFAVCRATLPKCQGAPIMTTRSRSAVGFVLIVVATLARSGSTGAPPPGTKEQQPAKAATLEVRMCVEQLRNPFWYEIKGHKDEVKEFWDRKHWEQILKARVDDGYNAVLYWPEPWTETAWPAFLVPHAKLP